MPALQLAMQMLDKHTKKLQLLVAFISAFIKNNPKYKCLFLGDLVSATFLTVSSFSRMIKQTLYPLGALLLGLSINQAQAQTRSEL